ncbi:MAG: SIMPL domain-containing protein [Nannocystis sp.]|nr:SIMPL domain-containing protein [Nannocystis sp.]
MGSKDDGIGTIEVSGEGRIKAKADRASVRLAVVTEAKTAKDAVAENAARANAVIAAIKALGVPESALATVGLSVGPIYNYDEERRVSVIVGYQATDALLADVAVALAGEVYDAGIEAGANESSGLSFHLADERPLRRGALQAAVEAAQADAEVVAAALGVKLRGPDKIEVDGGGAPITRSVEASLSKMSTPVLPADLSVSARVRVIYSYRC